MSKRCGKKYPDPMVLIDDSLISTQVCYDTVDGRIPAPPGMLKTLKIIGYLPYQLVQDFFHQQYLYLFI